MTEKVKLAIFGADLKATIKKYPISDSGNNILVTKGGENHFMPSFDHTSFIEFPVRYLWSFWKTSYQRIYFARRLAKKCVNFQTGELAGPSPEFVKEMGTKVMLDRLNKQKQETAWQIWLILAICLFTLLNVMGIV